MGSLAWSICTLCLSSCDPQLKICAGFLPEKAGLQLKQSNKNALMAFSHHGNWPAPILPVFLAALLMYNPQLPGSDTRKAQPRSVTKPVSETHAPCSDPSSQAVCGSHPIPPFDLLMQPSPPRSRHLESFMCCDLTSGYSAYKCPKEFSFSITKYP